MRAHIIITQIFFYFITIHEETRIILHILYASNQTQRNDLLVPI